MELNKLRTEVFWTRLAKVNGLLEGFYIHHYILNFLYFLTLAKLGGWIPTKHKIPESNPDQRSTRHLDWTRCPVGQKPGILFSSVYIRHFIDYCLIFSMLRNHLLQVMNIYHQTITHRRVNYLKAQCTL